MKKWIGRIAVLLIAIAFVYSTAHLLVLRQHYAEEEAVYQDAAETYTGSNTGKKRSSIPILKDLFGNDDEAAKEEHGEEIAPITVDFNTLLVANPEVMGWIYCDDSVISYPVCKGDNNDLYLHANYLKEYSNSGCIFADANNYYGITDYNIVLYGHHMGDGSMFASLKYWQRQDYLNEHPYMWFLTPERDYKLKIFAAYVTDAASSTYTIFREPGYELNEYLKNALGHTITRADFEPDGQHHYMVLSTCAYNFEEARSVVHGELEPVASAAGVPKPLDNIGMQNENGIG